MKNQFMRAEEVAQELEVSRSYAYRLIKQLNAELREKGYMTIAGRVNRQYLQERLYGMVWLKRAKYEESIEDSYEDLS